MSRAARNKLKLMVVDDEPDNLDLLYRTFRREFAVHKAESGLDALAVLEAEGEMAVIISDQRMPGMNGTEFLSKTVDRYPDTIRIILTGYTDVEDLVGAINSGKVFKYITKPWSPDELKSVVNQAADTYQVLKRRTNELNRALRRESLFNGMMSAIRESLDYNSMLPTIVKTLGETFTQSVCCLWSVEGDHLLPQPFVYPERETLEAWSAAMPNLDWVHQALTSQQTQCVGADGLVLPTPEEAATATTFVVPLVYQQECLAVLTMGDRDATPWADADIRLVEEVAEQAALALSQARLYQRSKAQTLQLKSELEVARQIQHNLLRQTWPDTDGVRVQARCYPAQEVGGDFFEVYVHPQGDVWLAVGDVSGKGVPAALFMASAISVLRQALAQAVSPEPDEVVRHLNGSISDNLIDSNRFITLAIARYTPSTGRLVYANAGHLYPMVWSHQAVTSAQQNHTELPSPTYLHARGVPLGILPVWKAKSGEITLQAGDALLLASDGLTEATVTGLDAAVAAGPPVNEAGGYMLRQEGLWYLLQQQPASLDLDVLLATLNQYTPDHREDDQTILSLEVL